MYGELAKGMGEFRLMRMEEEMEVRAGRKRKRREGSQEDVRPRSEGMINVETRMRWIQHWIN